MKITKIKVIKKVTFKNDILWVLFNCFLPTIKPVLTITSEQGPARSNDQPELSFKIFPSPFLGTGAERIKFWSRISRGEVCSRKFVLNKILWNRELYNGIVRVCLSSVYLSVYLSVSLSVRPSVSFFCSFFLSCIVSFFLSFFFSSRISLIFRNVTISPVPKIQDENGNLF